MPSPFPGMYPYLEPVWSCFVLPYLVELDHQLIDALSPDYYPLLDSYKVVTLDSSLRFRPTPILIKERAGDGPEPIYVNHALPHAGGVSFIKIQDRAERKTRAVVHLLDPIIKKRPGRIRYLRWRAKMLKEPISFIEVDLLRKGRRPPMLDPYPAAPYCVMISEPELRPICEVWPIQLRQSLPTIAIRITDKCTVKLDLQAAFTKAYDTGCFSRILDYKRKPSQPLTPDDEQWINRIAQDHLKINGA
jgi:hypothetical protein